jgi:sugar lactone lactonase YvrE
VLDGTDNTLFRVNPDGTTTVVADLSAFQRAHPVLHPEPDDFEPDGTWYSMVAVRGSLYAVEPNHGELDRITPDGQISRVVDVSASQGHVVPTAVAYHGNFYVGNLGTFGPDHQPESIYKITPSGQIQVVATGLSEVLGVDFDSQGQMCVLESSTGGVAPIPETGDVLRINADGTRTVLADGLTFPTAMRFGPDGNLYVSNFGFGIPGAGQIVRIDVPRALHVVTTSSHHALAVVSAEGLSAGAAPARSRADAANRAEAKPTPAHQPRPRLARTATPVAEPAPRSVGVVGGLLVAEDLGIGELGLDG